MQNTLARKPMRPKKPFSSIDGPGRQRISNVMYLLGISRSTVYRLIHSGELPKPDGTMGVSPFWLNETLRPYVVGSVSSKTSS